MCSVVEYMTKQLFGTCCIQDPCQSTWSDFSNPSCIYPLGTIVYKMLFLVGGIFYLSLGIQLMLGILIFQHGGSHGGLLGMMMMRIMNSLHHHHGPEEEEEEKHAKNHEKNFLNPNESWEFRESAGDSLHQKLSQHKRLVKPWELKRIFSCLLLLLLTTHKAKARDLINDNSDENEVIREIPRSFFYYLATNQ